MKLLKKNFEKIFLKKRNIFLLDIDRYKYKSLKIKNKYSFFLINKLQDIKLEHYNFLKNSSLNRLNYEKIKNRLLSGNYFLIFLWDSECNRIIGSYWILYSKTKKIFHDSFFLEPKSALLCNAFVNKSYRKQGLYTFLINEVYNYCISIKCFKIYTIIEASNKSSFRANSKFPIFKESTQYLVKFFSINILSLIFTVDKSIPSVNCLVFNKKG